MIKIIIIIFAAFLGIVGILLLLNRKKKSPGGKGESSLDFEKFQRIAGIPLSYLLLFVILYRIPWTSWILSYKWELTIMLIVVMMSIDIFTGVTEEDWEKSPKRKKARFHLNTGLILLLVYIVVSANGWKMKTIDPVVVRCSKTYDFSRVKPPGKVIVHFRQDCVTKVTLPPRVAYRTRPDADYKIRFIDGAEFIGGPGRQVWLGARKGLFQVIGLSSDGTIEIFLEKA